MPSMPAKPASSRRRNKSSKMSPKDLELLISRLSHGPSTKPVKVIRTILGPVKNGQNGATSAGSFVFTLNDLYDVTDLTSNFDIYRLAKVEFEVRSVSNACNVYTTEQRAVFMAAVDLDDSTTPTLSSISQYDKMKIATCCQSLKFVFEPRFATSGDNGANNLVALNIPGTWIDCAQTGVVHRGLKYFVTAAASAQIPAWQIVTRYHFEFARQR
jgi:hypothetical protein